MRKLLFLTCMLFSITAFSQAQQTSPVWPGCENEEDLSACFNQKLGQHVQENYEYPMNDDNEYVRGKVSVSFDINQDGEVEVNSIEGEQPQVNEAARQVISEIPNMEPATLNGEPDARTFTVGYNF